MCAAKSPRRKTDAPAAVEGDVGQDRIIAAEPQIGTDLDPALRPQRLADFVGQRDLRRNLEVYIHAARERGEALDHVLLSGPPGLGKTTLAQIIAKELGSNFRTTTGPVIQKPGDLASLLSNVEEGDVLFVDEIHRLNPQVEEILYPAMEDFQLDVKIGEGPTARSIRIDLPRFTLVGATTRSGMLSRPLRERFGIPLRLNFYEADELSLIVQRAARLLGLPMLPDGAMEIARRSRGTPRVSGRLLRRVRDICQYEGLLPVTADAADTALLRLDVDKTGLDALDRKYMRRIGEVYGGGPVGVETMAAGMGEERDTLEETVEPYLIQQGLLQRTQRGRVLTAAGWAAAGLAVPAGIQAAVPEQLDLLGEDA